MVNVMVNVTVNVMVNWSWSMTHGHGSTSGALAALIPRLTPKETRFLDGKAIILSIVAGTFKPRLWKQSKVAWFSITTYMSASKLKIKSYEWASSGQLLWPKRVLEQVMAFYWGCSKQFDAGNICLIMKMMHFRTRWIHTSWKSRTYHIELGL